MVHHELLVLRNGEHNGKLSRIAHTFAFRVKPSKFWKRLQLFRKTTRWNIPAVALDHWERLQMLRAHLHVLHTSADPQLHE